MSQYLKSKDTGELLSVTGGKIFTNPEEVIKKDQKHEEDEELDVDKKLEKLSKESFPDPVRKKHKEEDLDEAKMLEEAQEAIKYFLQEDEKV